MITINRVTVKDLTDEEICKSFHDHGYEVMAINRDYCPSAVPLSVRRSNVELLRLTVMTRHRLSSLSWHRQADNRVAPFVFFSKLDLPDANLFIDSIPSEDY